MKYALEAASRLNDLRPMAIVTCTALRAAAASLCERATAFSRAAASAAAASARPSASAD